MKDDIRMAIVLSVVLAVLPAAASPVIKTEGQASVCYPLPPLSGSLAPQDAEAEQAFCAIDVSSDSVAMCPKTWSTSPAALIYSLENTQWQGRATAFEKEVCAIGGHARDQANRELAVFKNSLNGRDTSGTFAPASLLYYHFSRLLQTRLQVPVAVRVEFPVADYRQRIVQPGLSYSKSGRLKMLHAGWQEMDLALSDPTVYAHRRELFSDDRQRLSGVFLLGSGRRYGPEVNGTRASGWGDGQNRDFQQTVPFRALRVDKPLAAAIDTALAAARVDPATADKLPDDLSAPQVAWWMAEVAEIVVLDSILGQQDRIGNIDYHRRWLWLENGVLQASHTAPPGVPAQQLRTSILNDNDAGVRSGYANYSLRTDMLRGWHHMPPGLYRRLQALAADLSTSGPVAVAIRERYRLSSRESEGLIKRAVQVASTLRARCESGALRFDLAPSSSLMPAQATEEAVPCE